MFFKFYDVVVQGVIHYFQQFATKFKVQWYSCTFVPITYDNHAFLNFIFGKQIINNINRALSPFNFFEYSLTFF